MRNISPDPAKLRTLCERAHNQTGSPVSDVIDHISFATEALTLTHFNEQSIGKAPTLTDYVSYNVTRRLPFPLPKHHMFYFTKGDAEGCIWFLIRWRRNRPYFRYGTHFCNVEVPV